MNSIVTDIAAKLNAARQTVRSSNGRHLKSANVTRSNASSITLADGEARSKGDRDAFAFVKALDVIHPNGSEFRLLVETEAAALLEGVKPKAADKKAA